MSRLKGFHKIIMGNVANSVPLLSVVHRHLATLKAKYVFVEIHVHSTLAISLIPRLSGGMERVWV